MLSKIHLAYLFLNLKRICGDCIIVKCAKNTQDLKKSTWGIAKDTQAFKKIKIAALVWCSLANLKSGFALIFVYWLV